MILLTFTYETPSRSLCPSLHFHYTPTLYLQQKGREAGWRGRRDALPQQMWNLLEHVGPGQNVRR
jgi:hypothetical protein